MNGPTGETTGEAGIVGECRKLFDLWEGFATTGWAAALMFVWAFAEAIFWPVIPDFLLVLIVAGNRKRFYVPLAAALAGSAFGVSLLYSLGYWFPVQGGDVLHALPLVSESQIQRVSLAVSEDGLGALWQQPWSGIPLKVWALVGAIQGIQPQLAIPVFIMTRALRMALIATLTGVVVGFCKPFVRDLSLFVLGTYLILFFYGWWQSQLAT